MADKRITDVDYIDSLNSDESFFINQNSSIKQVNKSNIVWGITNGGTGATTITEAKKNLDVADKIHTHKINEIDTLEEQLSTINDTLSTINDTLSTKQDQWNTVQGTDVVEVTLSNHTMYNYDSVTSLTIVGVACQCFGTIVFSSTTPVINVSGFDISIGDDITEALADEIWEFSVSYSPNNKSCIVWKNWSK